MAIALELAVVSSFSLVFVCYPFGVIAAGLLVCGLVHEDVFKGKGSYIP